MRAVLFAAAALLLAACSEATGPAGDIRVETSQSSYGIIPSGPGQSLTVPFTVRNTGSATVAIPQCGVGVLAELQRREGGAWVTVASGLCASDLALYAPLLLAPGEAAQGSVTVAATGRFSIRVAVAGDVGQPFEGYSGSAQFDVHPLLD